MNINEDVKDKLKEFGIPIEDGVVYLMAMYFDMKASYLPTIFASKMSMAGIVSWDEKSKSLNWHLPLFEGQQTAFEWVKDWVQLFADRNKDRKGSVPNSTSRMKKFFAQNPDVRKEDVMAATQMYLRSTDAAYIMMSHYFITKGIGAERRDALLEWVEKYKESLNERSGRTGINNIMQ